MEKQGGGGGGGGLTRAWRGGGGMGMVGYVVVGCSVGLDWFSCGMVGCDLLPDCGFRARLAFEMGDGRCA